MLNRNKKILTVFSVLFVCAVFTQSLPARRCRSAKVSLAKYVKIIKKIACPAGEIAVYQAGSQRFALHGAGEDLRFMVLTGDYSQVRGYRGWTNCFIMLDRSGEVLDVRVVDSQDSPPYVKRVIKKGYLHGFFGRQRRHRKRNVDPDAVSGATLTCHAIRGAVNCTIEKCRLILKNIDFTENGPRSKNQELKLEKIR